MRRRMKHTAGNCCSCRCQNRRDQRGRTLMAVVFSSSARKAAMRRRRSALRASRSAFSFSFTTSAKIVSRSAAGTACTHISQVSS